MLSLGLVARPAAAVPLDYEPRSLLVGFEGVTAQARAAVHARIGATVVNRFAWIDVDVVRLPSSLDPPEAAQRYEREPGVAYADLNVMVRAHSIPNDADFGDLWGLHNTGQPSYAVRSDQTCCNSIAGNGSADINAPQGWDLAFGAGSFPSSGGIRVGIIDSGIDQTHPDLTGSTVVCAHALSGNGTVTSGACADDVGHGTHVAGTIAAHANNGIGVAGVAPNVELAIVRALQNDGQGRAVGTVADAIGALNYLRTTGGAKVVNMSIGHGGFIASEDNAMMAAYDAGMLLVASAGNGFNSTINYPAGYASVMSVASIQAADGHSHFSNTNSDVEIAAPGEDILSTIPGNQYAYYFGTSMAAPHVTGVGAMIMHELTFTNAQARTRLQTSAVDLGSAGRDNLFGYGRADLAGALFDVVPDAPIITSPAAGGSVASTSVAIQGTARSSTTITVKEGATTVGTATAAANGTWTVNASFTEGTHTITATSTSGGNTSAPSAPVTFTVDTVAPAAATIDSPAEGALINSLNVTFTGTAEPGVFVQLNENANLLGTATVDAGGAWSKTLTMTETAHAVSAAARDLAGNAGPASATRNFTIDSPPAVPFISSPGQNAHVAGPNVTITGTVQASTTVTVREGATTVGTTVAAGDGGWSIPGTFVDGGHTITATATDSGGTSLPATRSFATGAGPLTPIINSPASGSYNKPTVTVSGTAEPLTSIKIFEGTIVRKTLTTQSNGTWSTSLILSDGAHTFTVIAYDSGNTGSPPATRTFTTDGTVPAVTVTGGDPLVRTGVGSTVIAGGATDNIGVAKVHVKVVRPGGLIEFEGDATCTCAPNAMSAPWTINASVLPGVYTVEVVADDAAGNHSATRKVTLLFL